MVCPKRRSKEEWRPVCKFCGKERKSRLPEINGTHTYDADVKVSNTDLYDVADKDFVDFAQRHAAI
jgi:hypothetical protein